MKKIFKKTLAVMAALFLLAFTSTSCVNQIIDEAEDIPQGEPTTLAITTRSGDNTELTYPIKLYAFNAAGTCVNEKTLNSATDGTELVLTTGDYTLVALSGIEGYSIPAPANRALTLADVITLPDDVLGTDALKMGRANVKVTDESVATTITLTAAVSRIGLSLTGIPEGTTAASVTFGKLYDGITFDGQYSGEATPRVNLTQSNITVDGTEVPAWTASTFYVFPGATDTSLTLTITLTNNSGTTDYAYTAPRNLVANTPYIFSGNYQEGFGASSTLSSGAWAETQHIDFRFGGGKSEGSEGSGENGEGNTGSGDTTNNGNILVAGSIWNGHFVALADTAIDNKSVTLTLLSLNEWINVPAGISTSTNPNAAANYATAYSESNIKDWDIPTAEQAVAISSAIAIKADVITNTNNKLATINGTPLSYGIEENKSIDIQYLCENAKEQFQWDTGNVVGTNKNRTYRLRLVSSVTINIE